MTESRKRKFLPHFLRNRLMRDTSLATPVSDMQTMPGLIKAYWLSDQQTEGVLFAGGITALSMLIGMNTIQMGLQYAEVAANLANYHSLATNITVDAFANLTESVKWAAGFTAAQAGLTVSRHLLSTNLHRRWTGWLRTEFSKALLSGQNSAHHIRHYKVKNKEGHPEPLGSVDQRIADCTKDLTGAVTGLSMGAITATSTFLSAAYALIQITQPVKGLDFLGQYGTATLAFGAAAASVTVGTYIAARIGRLITQVNKRVQETEATYRNNINTISRTAFYIAASSGKNVEEPVNQQQHQEVSEAWYKHNFVHAGFMGFSSLYNPFSTHIVSYLPGLANYLGGSMALKSYLQTTGTVGGMLNSMEWFIDVMPALANLKTNTDRITDVSKAIHETRDPKEFYQRSGVSDFVYRSQNAGLGLTVNNLALMHEGQDQAPFLTARHLRLRPGEWAQIDGANGAGKSCFMKAIEGKYLWPYGHGMIAVNDDIARFYATQDIELQPVTLRQLANYSTADRPDDDERVENALTLVGLEKLLPFIDETGRGNDLWGKSLSGGEKQKLILARILLKNPGLIFLDEANSAMDVEAKETFYALLKHHCPDAMVVAVVHEKETPRMKSGELYFKYRFKITDGVMKQERNWDDYSKQIEIPKWPASFSHQAYAMPNLYQGPPIN